MEKFNYTSGSATDGMKEFGRIVDAAFYRGERFEITSGGGTPKAVLIGIEDFENMQRLIEEL